MCGHCMRHLSSDILARCCLLRSWNWVSNSSRNWVHTMGKFWLTWSSPSIQVPMSLTHPATSSPLIRVRVNETFLIGELNPAMSWLTRKYALTSSMKSSALVRSPVKIAGFSPMVLTCYNPPTNFSFFPSSGPPSTQPAVPFPQPISTAPAPAPAPPAQPTSSSQPAPLAFNPFLTSHLPLYNVTDFYEPPQGYAQLQQPLGSPLS